MAMRHLGMACVAGAVLAGCGGGSGNGGNAEAPRLLADTGTVGTGAAAGTANAPRIMENLGRGVVAVRTATKNTFISWRLLGLDPDGIAFNVYRSADGAAPVKLNATPLTQGTNYLDTTANMAVANTYTVRPVVDGVEGAASAGATLSANHTIEPMVRVPLSALPGAGYYTKYLWVGDLDGDGEYDFVVDRLAPFDPTNDDIGLGNQYLEAYKRDGTRLWQIDLGPNSRNTYNIHPGSTTLSMGMYDGVTVYDLDGDGKAEVVLKVANGVKFGDGSTFTDSDNEKQYIAVLNGTTGTPLATRAFPTTYYAQGGALGTQLGIGYADGVTPTIYFWGRNRNKDKSFNNVFASWSWNGGTTITENWVLPLTEKDGYWPSHQMRIIDLDGDGKDEVLTGNFAVNSNGTTRYILPGVVHGDRFYVGKLDATSSGMQGYGIQQNNPSGLLEYYYDATNGNILWSHSTTPGTLVDVGRGIVGDIDPASPGYEVWSYRGGVFSNGNTQLTATNPWPNQILWWDGDLRTEEIGTEVIDKWDPVAGAKTRVLTMYKNGCSFGGRDNPVFFGDILGDWRTEVVCMNTDMTELQVYTTNIATTTRLYTMMHNPAYRNHTTIKGYMQSPLPDYYLGTGMSMPPAPNIRYAGTGTFQAEAAVVGGGSVVMSNRAGYNGSGFVDFPASGGSLQFNNINGGAGGTRTIRIRYANGNPNPRIGVLKVNGVAQNVTFRITGSWDKWITIDVPVTLAAGLNNTLRLESTGQDIANIDEIVVP
jgi:hypothetical protein